MSYGIICRQLHCQSYAAHEVIDTRNNSVTYVCDSHIFTVDFPPESTKIRKLANSDHRGPEGMKSLKDQGK